MAESILFLNHMKISSCEVCTCLAVTPLIQGSEISCVYLGSEFDLSLGGKCGSKPGCSGGKHAVEHIDSQGNAKSNIDWVTDPHQISRLIFRKILTAVSNNPEKVLFGFTTCQSPNSEAICIF